MCVLIDVQFFFSVQVFACPIQYTLEVKPSLSRNSRNHQSMSTKVKSWLYDKKIVGTCVWMLGLAFGRLQIQNDVRSTSSEFRVHCMWSAAEQLGDIDQQWRQLQEQQSWWRKFRCKMDQNPGSRLVAGWRRWLAAHRWWKWQASSKLMVRWQEWWPRWSFFNPADRLKIASYSREILHRQKPY